MVPIMTPHSNNMKLCLFALKMLPFLEQFTTCAFNSMSVGRIRTETGVPFYSQLPLTGQET